MYPVNDDYIEANYSTGRQTRITGTLTLTNGTAIAIESDDLKTVPIINNQCTSDQEITLGQAFQGSLSLTIYSDLDRHLIYGATVELSKGVLSGNEWIEIPLGRFIVTDCVYSGLDALNITALDEMDLLDKKYDGSTVVGKPYDILNYISVNTGLELGQTREEIEILPNGSITYTLPQDSSIETFRDMAGDLAACLCGFCTIGRDGKLYVKSFATDVCRTIEADYRGKDKICDYTICYTRAGVTKADKYVEVGDPLGQFLDLGENAFMMLMTDALAKATLNNILRVMSSITYTPASISLVTDDPSFELGDMVEIVGYTAGESTIVPIHKYTWKWRGQHKITSVGKDPHMTKAKSKAEKTFDGAISKIKEIESNLLLMTNVEAIPINEGRKTIARLSFGVSKDRSLPFHGVCRINMESAGTVKFYYDLNGIDDPFVHEVQVPPGVSTATLFLPINASSNALNVFTVSVVSEDAIGEIGALGFRAILNGIGIYEADEWNGNINREDLIPIPYLVNGIDIVDLSDIGPSINIQAPLIVIGVENVEPSVINAISVKRLEDGPVYISVSQPEWWAHSGEGMYAGSGNLTTGLI